MAEGVGNDAERGIVDPPERDRRQDRRDDIRKEHDRPDEPLEHELAIQHDRQGHAQHQLDRAGDDRVQERVECDQLKERIAEEAQVVLEPDEMSRAADDRIGQAKVDSEQERVAEENQEEDLKEADPSYLSAAWGRGG